MPSHYLCPADPKCEESRGILRWHDAS